jgi:hypothetical protein
VADRAAATRAAEGFSLVQINDSHIGFAKAANPDAKATFQEGVGRRRAAHRPRRRRLAPFGGRGYRRAFQSDLHQAGRLQLLLRHPSEDGGKVIVK